MTNSVTLDEITKNVTFDEISHIRKLLAAPAPEPTCEPDCEHIECSFVVACEKYTAEQARLAKTLTEPLLDALEQMLHDLGQAQGQEKQTAMTLDGFVGDLEKAVNAQVPTEIYCPKCNMLHVDQDEWATTRLHRKHLCHGCGNIWAPYAVTTTGCDFHVECRKKVEDLEATLSDYEDHDIWDYIQMNKELKEQRDAILVFSSKLETRRDELLAMVANLSQTVPLESEVAEALNQRGALLAEIGTLRARVAELEKPTKSDSPNTQTEYDGTDYG